MELIAVIEALKSLKTSSRVKIYSDSQYVVDAFNKHWLENWKRRGWKNSSNKIVQNKDLWQELDKLVEMHNVEFIKVKGHSDNYYNNLCDELASNATQNCI